MGQIADDMIDGLACSHCGIYFKVICHSCWKELDPNERNDAPAKATNEEL